MKGSIKDKNTKYRTLHSSKGMRTHFTLFSANFAVDNFVLDPNHAWGGHMLLLSDMLCHQSFNQSINQSINHHA